jgi:regulatory protein
MTDRKPRPAGPPPTVPRLREVAIAHLARFAATEAGLRRVLVRRVERWARAAEAEGQPDIAAGVAAGRAAAAEVARALAAARAVDDAAFAASRARRLLRGGRSPRATLAHLREKGVDAETAAAAIPEDDRTELAAALAFCRRRRIGPFAAARDAEADRRALAALARAGFAHAAAVAALGLAPEEAEDLLLAARQP